MAGDINTDKLRKILIDKNKVTTCLSGNSRNSKSFGIRHLYRAYLSTIGVINSNGRIIASKKINNPKYIDYKTFVKVIDTCNDLITTEISKGDIFKAPSSLGSILIKKAKFTPFMLENLFDKTGILATSHSNDVNYRLRIYWKKGNTRRDNFYEATLYKFRPCSSFKKKVYDQVTKNHLGTRVYNGVY